MSATMTINQAGLSPAGTPGVARDDGLSTGALVTITSLAHVSTFEVQLLWVGQHPAPDTTSVASLQAAGPGAVSFSPMANTYGTWRIELVTDRGTPKEDRQELAFAIKTAPGDIRIPAANERSDSSASLANGGPSYVARSTFNAPDSITGSPFRLGTYVSWWRSLGDLIHAFNKIAGGGAYYQGHCIGALTQSATTWTDFFSTIGGTYTDDLQVGITRSGSTFTFAQAGRYRVRASFVCYSQNVFIAYRLRRGSTTLIQRTTYSSGSAAISAPQILDGIITVAAGDSINLQYAASASGIASSVPSQIAGEDMVTGDVSFFRVGA